MTNPERVLQIAGFEISPSYAEQAGRGLLIEFLPHPELGQLPPVRVLLPELVANQFLEKLGYALTWPRQNPSPSGALN